MALVTIQRSPSPASSIEEESIEVNAADVNDEVLSDIIDSNRSTKSFGKQKCSTNEYYFAVKGAAIILPQNECTMIPKHQNSAGGEIQLHLQAMLHLLRSQDTLKMAVRLESVFDRKHTRYMAIVSTLGRQDNVEFVLLGIDYDDTSTPKQQSNDDGVDDDQPSSSTAGSNCSITTTIGLVLPIWASTRVMLDGDGGITIESNGSQHVFKPVSVQAMWSAFQSLHKEHKLACESYPYFPGGLTHTWSQYYEARINSKEAYRIEWHYVSYKDDHDELRIDSLRKYMEKPPERAFEELKITNTLKDIMQSVDLDEVTSKDIRRRLEDRLGMNLTFYKEFIDQEMLVILGQMDKPSKIFPYLYLGTEWNASNWDELKQNGVGRILNVTKEVDNFFPNMFHYMKIRVTDEESTELLKHWDLTFRFIQEAKETNTAVLVHCKKGISRSSSTVVAYAMKAYNWSLEKALNYVKEQRNCITPNRGFLEQLRIYQGILQASQHRRSQLFNQLRYNPQSPDIVPWGGLLERSKQQADSSTTCSVNRSNSSKSIQIEQSPFSSPAILLVASSNILKYSGSSCDSKITAKRGSLSKTPVKFGFSS